MPVPSITRSPEIEVLRLLSFALFLAIWWIAALFVGGAKLPSPPAVLQVMIAEASSGALFLHLGATLARVALAFTLAMSVGSAIGYLMGRVKLADRLGDPWLILLLNLPALVVIVLAYIWAGLTEAAAIAAIAINKLPTAIVTLREGTRALDRSLDEMASVFAMPRWRAFRHEDGPADRDGRQQGCPRRQEGRRLPIAARWQELGADVVQSADRTCLCQHARIRRSLQDRAGDL